MNMMRSGYLLVLTEAKHGIYVQLIADHGLSISLP